jgi:hypothetical protein
LDDVWVGLVLYQYEQAINKRIMKKRHRNNSPTKKKEKMRMKQIRLAVLNTSKVEWSRELGEYEHKKSTKKF